MGRTAIDGKGGSKDERSILELRDKETLDGVPNKVLSLVITSKLPNHVVSRTLIDEGSSCHIKYVGLFEQLGLDNEGL